MAPVNHPLLTSLFRRLLFFCALAGLGLAGLVATRLSLFKVHFPDLVSRQTGFYADCVCLTILFLGLILLVRQARALAWRLRRVDDLGESRW